MEKLLTKMTEENIHAGIITKKENIYYVTGFEPSSFSILIIKEEPLLLVSKMDITAAEKYSNVQVDEFKSLKEIKKRFEKNGFDKVFIEPSTPFEIVKKLEGNWDFVIKDFISYLRMIKTKHEIKQIKKAISISKKIIKEIAFDGSENEVAASIDYNMRINGAEKPAFETIVTSGKRSSYPHVSPSNKKLENPILIDWGARYNHYCSDMTRTIVKTEKEEEMFEIVLEAQKKGIDAIRSGITASKIDRIVRDVIKEYGYGKYFIHSTGHGVGLEVHERPSLSKKDDTKLKTNMVITVEPGIYIPEKFGVRVEDMVLVKKKRAKVLTKKLPLYF
ncbi:peptidase M24 [Methanothermus fervidus DSM 2088]|uniref:Peptidase M24 n=1 Tax=Methanothermus fervidus (strain ATCC 43054 / DSM 2088 / JCM 10308 / V24 S) TaxID=523846 RepID=E3GXX1_METFV|nr:M24 family metallopeptidase [Methanothermus fervidus]ADP77153.1 peptidase M24 [Methanothermus fervidus DSM 2088]